MGLFQIRVLIWAKHELLPQLMIKEGGESYLFVIPYLIFPTNASFCCVFIEHSALLLQWFDLVYQFGHLVF